MVVDCDDNDVDNDLFIIIVFNCYFFVIIFIVTVYHYESCSLLFLLYVRGMRTVRKSREPTL